MEYRGTAGALSGGTGGASCGDSEAAGLNWLEATAAAWRKGKPPPPKPDNQRPWWAREWPAIPHDEYPSSMGAHLISCGCQWGTIMRTAMESRLAMAAIGLERFRLRHGVWPESLEAARDFIPGGLRHNPMTGNPFVYKLLPEGGWMLQADGDWRNYWRSALPLDETCLSDRPPGGIRPAVRLS